MLSPDVHALLKAFDVRQLERLLFCGDFTTDSEGDIKKPRWGIALSHDVRRDDDTAEPAHWNFMRSLELGDWLGRYVRDSVEGKPQGINLQPH